MQKKNNKDLCFLQHYSIEKKKDIISFEKILGVTWYILLYSAFLY